MTKSEFKVRLFELLDSAVTGMTYDEQMDYAEMLLVKYQSAKENDARRDTRNKGEKWADEELKIILSDAPSKSNCLKYAKLFHRGYGSIEQIYRWSTTTQQDIDGKRPNDAFVAQIKRVAKELGLRGA